MPKLCDPLSREVSEPNTSSTESVPKVASRPVARGAVELAQEAEST